MDNLSIAAASGLRSRMTSLDLLANNLANSSTAGFKSDREYYGLYSSDDAENSVDGGQGASLPNIEKQWTDFSQGVIEATGNPTDVAISGPGFLSVTSPQGTLYTRNGSLKVLPSGELANSDGFPLRGTGGAPINVGQGKLLTITREGAVQRDGQTVGQLEIVDFKKTESLVKAGNSTFRNTDAKNLPAPATNFQLEQGKLEGSNVQVATGAMRLVGVMRQFEMLQKAVSIANEMDTKTIQEVARTGA